MTTTVKFTIEALNIFNKYEPLVLENEICWAVYCMASDNEFGDITSEFLLDTCNNQGSNFMEILPYIDYNEEDLSVSGAWAYQGSNNADIEFTIPVIINA